MKLFCDALEGVKIIGGGRINRFFAGIFFTVVTGSGEREDSVVCGVTGLEGLASESGCKNLGNLGVVAIEGDKIDNHFGLDCFALLGPTINFLFDSTKLGVAGPVWLETS